MDTVKDMYAYHNYVVVEVDQPREVVTGRFGLVSPQRTDSFKVTGVVRTVGPTCRIDRVRPGVRVLFPPYGAGQVHTISGVEHVVLLDHEILGVLS